MRVRVGLALRIERTWSQGRVHHPIRFILAGGQETVLRVGIDPEVVTNDRVSYDVASDPYTLVHILTVSRVIDKLGNCPTSKDASSSKSVNKSISLPMISEFDDSMEMDIV